MRVPARERVRMRFYTPPVPEPVRASEGRFVANRMEADAVMRRVSRDLYASPTAGLRELLANEITAARAAKRLGADPRIEVTVLPDQIVVWGVDSLGMERGIFDEVFTVLGRSGNFDGTTPGQFGLGRAAYVTISDHMLLETRHRNGDCYTVLGVEGRGFQVDMGEPDIPFGTRVTLVPRDGTTMLAMREMVESIAGRCGIPITLTTENGTERLARLPLMSGGCQHLSVDFPDVEVAIRLEEYYGWDGYLCGIPIEFNYRGKYRLSGAVDIRDERKYMPTPDRERMTEEAENAISNLIDREIERRLKGFPQNAEGALSHPDRALAVVVGAAPHGLMFDFETLDSHGQSMRRLSDLDGGPYLSCRSFDDRLTGAVLERFPDAVFIKDIGGLTTMREFMETNGIEPLPPENEHFVTVHTEAGPERVDPVDPPAGLTIIRVADDWHVTKYHHMLRNGGVALTTHDVAGAVPLAEFVMEARAGVFDTSHGMMTGGEIMDRSTVVRRTARRNIVDGWRDCPGPGFTGIVVWDDGTPEHEASYELLQIAYVWALPDLGMDGWGEMAVEAYITIENPTIRRMLAECDDAARPGLCDGLLELDGKQPVPHDDFCVCERCGSGS